MADTTRTVRSAGSQQVADQGRDPRSEYIERPDGGHDEYNYEEDDPLVYGPEDRPALYFSPETSVEASVEAAPAANALITNDMIEKIVQAILTRALAPQEQEMRDNILRSTALGRALLASGPEIQRRVASQVEAPEVETSQVEAHFTPINGRRVTIAAPQVGAQLTPINGRRVLAAPARPLGARRRVVREEATGDSAPFIPQGNTNGFDSVAEEEYYPQVHKYKQPDNFNGKDPENLNTWLAQVEIYADNIRIRRDKIAGVAAGLLTGPALQEYINNCRDTDGTLIQITNWDTFQELMRQSYGQSFEEHTVRNKIDALKQTSSVDAYTRAFKHLAAMLVGCPMAEVDQVRAYYRGLKPSLQAECKHDPSGAGPFTNLDRISKFAASLEITTNSVRPQDNHQRYDKQAERHLDRSRRFHTNNNNGNNNGNYKRKISFSNYSNDNNNYKRERQVLKLAQNHLAPFINKTQGSMLMLRRLAYACTVLKKVTTQGSAGTKKMARTLPA